MEDKNDRWSEFYKQTQRHYTIQMIILVVSLVVLLACIPLGIVFFNWVIESDLPDWLKWLLLR